MSRRDEEICSVASLCLLFSMAEYLIPKPLPFCKLGLANLPLLLILSRWDWGGYLLVVTLKLLGSLLVGGTLFSPIALITASGGIASALAMKGLDSLCKERISFVGISVMGALASNLVQLASASLLVYGTSIWAVAPLLCSIGLASGIILGFLAMACERQGLVPAEVPLPLLARKESHPVAFSLLALAILCLCFEPRPFRLLLVWMLLLVAQKGAGRRIHLTYPLVLLFSLLLLSLFEPVGKILWSWGPFTLASLSLVTALRKGLRLICMVTASQSMVGLMPHIPGRFFRLLSETLAALGTYQLPRKGQKPMEVVRNLFSGTRQEASVPRKAHPLLISVMCILAIALCIRDLL